MKIALASLYGRSSKSILRESRNFFDKSDHLDIRNIEVRVGSKELNVLYQGKPLDKYDCIYVRGSFRYALLQQSLTRALHSEIYMPIEPHAFTLGHNKFLTLLELQKNKVPLPTTYFVTNIRAAKKLLEQVNYPIIMKIPSGTQGKGVMFADSISSAKSMLDALDTFKQPYILQEFVETDATDIRAIVLGDKVIAAMKRKAAKGELRANIHAGGIGTNYELDYDTEQVAVKSAKSIGADIVAVDILDSGGKPQVIEVNLSPGLTGIEKATGKNIAKEIAKFLFNKTKEFKNQKSANDVKNILDKIEVESLHGEKKEILTNLDIKAGIIKLPKIVTDISKFNSDDEVAIQSKKGEIIIKKQEIKK
ncbi:MAG: RimK family alpha-L-glutamate ligase [Nanoarchaeota archaeon]